MSKTVEETMGVGVGRATALERGRESFERRMWGEAYRALSAADREAPLDPEDLERLGIAARLIGNDAESGDLLARLHQELLARAEAPRAARAAVWLAIRLHFEGKDAPSGAWVARARRLLDQCGLECVEQGYVLLPGALKAAREGDSQTSCARSSEAASIGERFGDPDLMTLGRLGQGRALVRLGQIPQGMALLDEAMVAVTAGEVSPVIMGDVYCSVIDACHETFDLRRAQEWTGALERWCTEQPELVPYRGICLIHRSALLQLHGEWPDAADQASQACAQLSRPPAHPATGAAFYQCAEVHRLRGELAEAEESYRQANRWGRDPQPGLALLRLAQGRVEAAAAAIRRALEEARNPRTRSRILAPAVEILLAAGDRPGARSAAEELVRIAETTDTLFLRALAAHASGVILLADGKPGAALAALREATGTWRQLDAPYEAARARLQTGQAHQALGNEDAAALDIDAARHAFLELGAALDLKSLEPLPRTSSPLTAREIEVLRLVATGRTNRAIADALGISEKTVARHLSNIFTKLGLSTRAAATAYAYQHGLVSRPT
jgi:DNA-binding NarL/FixJ family response regulator